MTTTASSCRRSLRVAGRIGASLPVGDGGRIHGPARFLRPPPALPQTAGTMQGPSVFDIAAVVICLAAFFGWVNHRFLRLPFTIGLTAAGLAASAVVAAVDALAPGLGIGPGVRRLLTEDIDFHESLMHGMLSFLLFAGAMHVDLGDLLKHRGPILSLATVGVALSTAIVGLGSWALFSLCGVEVPLPWCLVFGALISPTDPIAVLGVLKTANAPKGLEVKIAGESLFNDGVGVVVFTLLVAAASGPAAGAGHGVGEVFLKEVAGGVLLGLAAGWLTERAMASLEEPNLEVLFSVALVMGVTAAAFLLHSSAPLACVTAGLLVGNRGRRVAMGEGTRIAMDAVWSFLDETLNAVLFLLVGLEVVALTFRGEYLLASLLLVPLVLLARFLSVLGPVSVLSLRRTFTPGAVRVLTWGGLRGGISVALALSLPRSAPGEVREAILFATYAVVLFSLLVQGLTMGRLLRSVVPAALAEEEGPA